MEAIIRLARAMYANGETNMNTTFETRFTRTVLAAAIAGIFSAPAAWAEEDVESLIRPDSEIEVGLGHTSQDSFKYGDYTGLQSSGAHLIGNVLINKRGEDSANYVIVDGRNLGLDSRSLGLQAGEQGNYGVRFEYDEIPKLYSDSYKTPFVGAGTTNLTLPGFSRGTNTSSIANAIRSRLTPYDVESKRKGTSLGFTKQLGQEWDAELNYKREEKDGTKLMAAMMQLATTGGNRGAVIVPEPVDYLTDQYEALVRYSGEKLQLQFGYYASLFENDHSSLSWTNPYLGGNATGRYGLPPDNEFHQVNASGSYAFTPSTRMSGALSFGRMTQNDPFLPYTTGATQVTPTSDSLRGKVDTVHASLRLTSKLMTKLNLTAGMRYDDRDNHTPISLFRYITGDSTTGVGTGTLNRAQDRWNMPLDIKKQVLYADLDYHLGSDTTLKFGYDFHKVDHNYEPTTGDKEHTVKAEAKHRFNDMVAGSLSYAYSDRDASDYNGAAPLSSTYMSAYLANLATNFPGKTYAWLEAPGLRKYFLADRKREKVGATASFSPNERLDLEFGAHYNRDKYPDTFDGIGLTRAAGWIASFDATLQATDALSGNFFASLDEYKTDQNGAHLTTTALATAAENGTIPAASLGVTTLRDRTLTLGLGMNYKPARKYEVGGTFTHSDSVGKSTFKVGSAVPNAPVPDLESRLNRLEMYGRYFMRKDVTFNVKYAYERYSSADWAWDAPLNLTSVGTTGTGGVLGTEQVSPKYNVHFLGVSVAYKF